MDRLEETTISRTIISTFHDKLLDRIVNDVLIVGAGPSGMMAAIRLARDGFKVTVLEKRLSPGGGLWGGGMAMSQAVIQDEALPLLDEIGVAHESASGGLHTTDAVELAAGLCLKTVQSGAALFNLMMVEDVCVQRERVTGVVVNRPLIGETLPVDPIMFSANAVVDGTGHDAAVVQALRRRGLLADVFTDRSREGPMDAAAGEAFVVENVAEAFPGLWVSGMSVCATFGGPRMGPIFGGMLLSGKRVAELVAAAVKEMRK
ncbi:MAG: thiazole biosynthesis protein [Phycisphaerales bacterium]|nr:MAG: thiazole biosynthesis protein [Phycisphaerales bacterium]